MQQKYGTAFSFGSPATDRIMDKAGYRIAELPSAIDRSGSLNILKYSRFSLTFRHRASYILGQAFRYSPENAFYIFNQQIYLLDRASLI